MAAQRHEEEQDVKEGMAKEGMAKEGEGNELGMKGQLSAPTGISGTGTAGMAILRKFPHLLTTPVILFCLIVALGTFGLVYATSQHYDIEGRQARDSALIAADGLAKQLSSASRAALCLAAVVRMEPRWPFLVSHFQVLAEELFSQMSQDEDDFGLMELSFLPFGRVRASLGKPVQRNSTADLFSPGFMHEWMPLETLQQGSLDIKGPNSLSHSDLFSFTAGYPVFFPDTDEDESWGHPDNITHPTGCPGPPCYDPETRRKFWGFTGALVNAGPILAGKSRHLERLLADDFSYLLTIKRPDGTNGEGTVVPGGPHPNKVTAKVTVALPGNSWELSVYNPRQEEIMTMRDGLIAMVVIMAFILSGLLLLLLVSAKKASVLLKEQLVTNRLLEEEKVSREALLGRQFDLIACFDTKPPKLYNKSQQSPGQQCTLERIAQARAAISESSRSKDEDFSVQELLAEGSFGKVYRGQWRGTDVAVKIIMLPSNMSGREKREKMVVWEAAISSSLIHPNICQTYHYRIKPVKESSRPGLGMDHSGSAVALRNLNGSEPRSGILAHSDNSGSSVSEEVHSYEVHLILEYCDRSSLRDALDSGAFLAPNGINYAAQLDCAMDVAKAMLHLHCNNILHLDLKTRNILLSSSGVEGKGVTCKVSDFGLSVRMDHMETHVSSLFQGTMTHMAPEVLLKGTCSKASDVYAFGIVLWELFTCGSPFYGVPPALLGHLIVKDGKRPAWPPVVPKGYRDLVEECWDQDPDARPTFEVILQRLTALRKELGHPTPPLQPIPLQRPQRRQPLHLHEGRASPQGQGEPSIVQLRSIDSKDFLLIKGPSTPSQAGCPACGESFGPLAEEADAPCFSHRAGCLQETPGRKKLMHPVSGARDRGDHGTGESSVPDPSMRASLTMSPSSLPLVQSPAMGPGVCAASHLHDPYSDMRHNAAWHQGSLNSSDWGSNCLQGRLGPFGMKRSARKGIAGEPLLAVGADGVPVRWANHNNSLFLHSCQLPSIHEDDAQLLLSTSPNSR